MSGILGHRGLLLTGARWSPVQLTVPPKVWLDDKSAVTNVSGFASGWANKGSLGGSFTQGTAANRPAITTHGSAPVIRFDGSNDALIDTSSTIALFRNVTSGWVFSVARRNTSGAAWRQIFEGAVPSLTTRFGVAAGAGSGVDRWLVGARRLDTDTTVVINAPSNPINTDLHLYMAQINYSTGVISQSMDGGTIVTGSSGLTTGATSNTNALHNVIGANAALSSWGAVDIAAILSGSGALLSTDDWRRLEGWAAWRYGIQSILPIGHPYKNSPP